MKKTAIFIIALLGLLAYSCGPGGSGTSESTGSDTSLFTEDDPDFFSTLEEKDIATRPSGNKKHSQQGSVHKKGGYATASGTSADGKAASPSPTEYRGKYHGLPSALEILHMADVQEHFLNVLVTPMAQLYAFDIFSTAEFRHADESVKIISEAMYDPFKDKHKQLAIISVDNKTPGYAKDLGFEHVLKKDVKAAHHLKNNIILGMDDLVIEENDGTEAVISFSFANKELPDGRKYFKHLQGLMYFNESGLSHVTLTNEKPFTAHMVYHIENFSMVYNMTRIAEKAYVIDEYSHQFKGAHIGKEFSAKEKVTYRNYQVR